MRFHDTGGILRQRRVITMRYVILLLLLAAVVLASGIVLLVVLTGVHKLFGVITIISELVLFSQILILLYTCIDHSEVKIHELRQKLSEAASLQNDLPPAVQEAMARISQDRHALITYARAQRDVELNNMVARIIDGNFTSLEQVNEALRPFTLHITGQTYVLALFHTLEIPDDAFDLNVENSLREFGYPNPLAAFFRTIIGEMFGTTYDCLISERSGIFRCIVYSAEDVQPSRLEREVSEISTKIISIFKDCLSITMLGAVCQARNDFGMLRISNDELTRLMDCRSFLENTKPVLTYGDLEIAVRTEQTYTLQMVQKQRLLDSLAAREYESARETIKQTIAQCESGDSTILLSRFVLSDMAYACLFSLPLPKEREGDIHELMMNTKSIQDFEVFFEVLISALESVPAGSNAAEWTSLMADYIDLHYMEPELSVSSVSDQFHYNPIYATKMFKADTGMNISEYIQDKRLNHSRAMLGQGKTIKEIAQESGFKSASAMTRAYTAKYGVTPGKLNSN